MQHYPDLAVAATADMGQASESADGIPAFLAKLWKLVDESRTNHLICWGPVRILRHDRTPYMFTPHALFRMCHAFARVKVGTLVPIAVSRFDVLVAKARIRRRRVDLCTWGNVSRGSCP